MGSILIFITMFLLGLMVGRKLESNHIESLKLREEKFSKKYVCTSAPDLKKTTLEGTPHLVSGSVVISVDFFKNILFIFRNIFGGESIAYGSLMDRAKREARLRMIESSPQSENFFKFRYYTTSVSLGIAGTVRGVEVFCCSTAFKSCKIN